MVISPESQWEHRLRQLLLETDPTPLSDADAIELEKTSRDVKDRLSKLNKACLTLKARLEVHPQISNVLHPESCSNFKALMRPGAGYGCLLSFKLKGGLSKAKHFYDALEVCKGPSLGTSFTLACPYVLLAHYKELDWANKCGVETSLIRVSVGLENKTDLWDRFDRALNA